MLSIEQLQDALLKVAEHKRLGDAIRHMYPGARASGLLAVADGRVTLDERDDPEAFFAVIGAIKRRQAAIEEALRVLNISLEAVPPGV